MGQCRLGQNAVHRTTPLPLTVEAPGIPYDAPTIAPEPGRDFLFQNMELPRGLRLNVLEVVARTADVRKWFNSILTERKQDIDHPESDLAHSTAVPPDSYVFCGRNGKPIGSFKKSFGRLIAEAGVEFDSFGQRRTIYSLRHTYATFRLQEGVNHYILAQNMGTSVAMLEQFYGHTSNVTAADELMKTSNKKGD